MQPAKIKTVLKGTLKKLNLYSIYKRQRALEMWKRICGKEVANISSAEKLTGTTLTVLVRDHIWASEISHFQYQYLKKYEEILGPGVVKEIRFKAKPAAFKKGSKIDKQTYDPESVALNKKEQKKVEEFISEIKDEKTRELAEKFITQKLKADAWTKKHGGQECFGCGVIIEKGNTFCPHCLRDLEETNREKLIETLEEEPWISFDEISKKITPISKDLYLEIKTSLIESLHRDIIDSIEIASKTSNAKSNIESPIKTKIATYAMLKSGKRPAELKDDVLRKILPESMYIFLFSFRKK